MVFVYFLTKNYATTITMNTVKLGYMYNESMTITDEVNALLHKSSRI